MKHTLRHPRITAIWYEAAVKLGYSVTLSSRQLTHVNGISTLT